MSRLTGRDITILREIMKIKGRKLETANEEVIVIPRGNDDAIIFKARAVLDMSVFEDLC
jgi:hypothetical protein